MTERISFTPSWLDKAEAPDKPVYFLRLGSVIERDEFDAMMDGRYRAGEVHRFQLRDIAIAGVRALVDPDDADALVQLIESEYGGEKLPPAEAAQVKEISDVLAKHWPDYAAAREIEARRNKLLPTLAFMQWCDGWENVADTKGKPLEYARTDKGEIPGDVLRRLVPVQLRVVGIESYSLQFGESDAKN